MKKNANLYSWMVKNFEEPLLQAEIYRADLLKCADNENCSLSLIAVLAALVMPIIIVAASMLKIKYPFL
ncbi:hypothetical protein [Desulfoscipio sp. XC116]|uniref:hypothetical protein n=1 Tax=Desulfoscipio sp. XC116 TaxID=3144975 RepID=UPI00325C1EE9